MAYAIPTASDIKARLPELEAVTDAALEFAIAEALRSVDETWLEGDFPIAITYLAAHIISLGQKAAAGGASTGEIVSETIGPLSFTYGQADSQQSTEATLGETIYGRKYKNILRRNHPSVLVVR